MTDALTLAQEAVLRRMPDRPSDGVRLRGGAYMTALSCVAKGLATQVGLDLVGGHFARLSAGRDALIALYTERLRLLGIPSSEASVFRAALESIGRNTCGREPLAAAYARGVLEENP